MYAPAYPQDPLTELYPDVYLLHGSIRMGPGMTMNRNMLVLRHADELTLVNPVRMDEANLARLEALGTVKHVVRLGDFHGLDDAFYCERYACLFWAQPQQATYTTPKPDQLINAESESPVPGSEFFIFNTARYPEAALFIPRHKLLITTDSVQYHADWSYFSTFTRIVFRLLGFRIGLNIGPPWRKRVTPKGQSLKTDFEQLLALDFDALVAAHGVLLPTGAKPMLAELVERTFAE